MQVIDSSAAASDRSTDVTGGPRPPSAPWREHLALAIVVGAMTAIMFAAHRSGHWWGDDWALYLRQAQSLLDGDTGRVAEENRFAVEASRGAPFSPPMYPWGFPLMLAPFVAVLGDDLDRLTIVPVLCAVVFACCWYALARPRLGVLPALVGVVAVTITPALLGWTELIQSEWPFLAVTGATLVAIDRAAASDAFLAGSFRSLALIGVGVAAAFSVRREGLAMVAAVGAAQLAALSIDPTRWRRLDPRADRAMVARLLTPHAVALAAVGLLQAVLPSTLVPQYSGTTIANTWRFAGRHLDHLAEVSGLKRPWDADAVVLGSDALGTVGLVVYLLAAAAGIALALTSRRSRDAHLAGYAVVAFMIGGSSHAVLNRYVCTVAPLLLLLGLVAIVTVARRWGGTRVATVTATAIVGAIALGNLANAHDRIDRATAFADAGSIEWGPTHPDAIAMFEAVERLTAPDDVVAAPKARAMTFATGRLAIQVDEYRPIPTDVDLALIVTERSEPLTAALLAEPDDYRRVWENTRFVLFEPVTP
jgi:uncharacterized membrane protein YhaH (DUF805 family)